MDGWRRGAHVLLLQRRQHGRRRHPRLRACGAALTRCLNCHAYETGRLKRDKGESLEARDVFDGLTAAVSVMVADPQFEGQTKGRLNNSEAQSAVQSFAYEAFGEWLASNPKETGRSSTGCC